MGGISLKRYEKKSCSLEVVVRVMYSVTLSSGSVRLVPFKTDDGVHYSALTENAIGLASTRRVIRGKGVFSADGVHQLGLTGRWVEVFGGILEFWTGSREVAEAVHATLIVARAA